MKFYKHFFLIISGFLFTSYLFAFEWKYNNYFSFNLTPQFEISNGVIKEYVFRDECLNTDHKLSELDWHLSTISLFNLQTDFDIFKYINLGFSGSFSVPQRSGLMQDYDWVNSVATLEGYPAEWEWEKDDPFEQTHFSEHVNHLDKFKKYKIYLGGNIYLPFELKISPHIAYYYELIKFSASLGYRNYKHEGFEEMSFADEYGSKTILSYQQESKSVLFGLNIKTSCIPHTIIKINFDISPKLTSLDAIDSHPLTGNAYLDSFKYITQILSDICIQYSFTKNHSAGFVYRIQYIPFSEGTTYNGTIDAKGNLNNTNWTSNKGYSNGGTERFIWFFGFNYSFSL